MATVTAVTPTIGNTRGLRRVANSPSKRGLEFESRGPLQTTKEGDVPRIARIFEDAQGEWRWHVQAANGEIVAEGESYTRKADAKRGLEDAEIEYDELRED